MKASLTGVKEAACDIRDEYALKQIARLLDKMAANQNYMNAIGEEGRQRIHELLDVCQGIKR